MRPLKAVEGSHDDMILRTGVPSPPAPAPNEQGPHQSRTCRDELDTGRSGDTAIGRIAPYLLTSCYERNLTMSGKKAPNEQTSRRVASNAAKVLADPKSSKAAKSAAGSALTQYVPPKKR